MWELTSCYSTIHTTIGDHYYVYQIVMGDGSSPPYYCLLLIRELINLCFSLKEIYLPVTFPRKRVWV